MKESKFELGQIVRLITDKDNGQFMILAIKHTIDNSILYDVQMGTKNYCAYECELEED